MNETYLTVFKVKGTNMFVTSNYENNLHCILLVFGISTGFFGIMKGKTAAVFVLLFMIRHDMLACCAVPIKNEQIFQTPCIM